MSATPTRLPTQAYAPLFVQAFAQGYHLASGKYESQPLTDDTMYGYIRPIMAQPELSPHWKAGVITGWFAALYHIPCCFDESATPTPPRFAVPSPRRVYLSSNDPDFLIAYGAGYQTFQALMGKRPVTVEHIFAELARCYLMSLDEQTLHAARWCAGWLAGWFAALFRVPCLVSQNDLPRQLAPLERRAS